jgi:lysophospholipase L1-like esterase
MRPAAALAILFISAAGQSTAVISGVVQDDTCARLPGVRVIAASGSAAQTVVTDTRGAFSLAADSGRVSIRAELQGFRVFRRDAVVPGSALTITLRIGDVVTHQRVAGVPEPPREPGLIVRAQTAECRPLGGARVTLRSGEREFAGMTDRAGRLAPLDVPPALYEVTAEHPGFATLVVRRMPSSVAAGAPLTLTLEPGDPQAREFSDPPDTFSRAGIPMNDAPSTGHTLIVAMGDSTTAGTPGWMSPREAPPTGRGDETSQYAYWLMKTHPEWDVRNMGVNGERSDQIRARLEQDVVALRPAVVVIVAGVNDVYQGRPASHVIAQLKAMYDRAREAGIKVIAGSIIPYNTASIAQNAAMRTINNWIREYVAADPNMRFVDTRAAVAAAADPDRLASSPDGLHPDAAGYRRMAEAIARVLEQAIARGAGL